MLTSSDALHSAKQANSQKNISEKDSLVAVVGRLQVRSWDDSQGVKRWTTEVVIEEQHFAESKGASAEYQTPDRQAAPAKSQSQNTPAGNDGFYPIDTSIEDDDLPF